MEYRDRADAARSSNPDLRILAARPLFGEDDAGPPAESLKDARAAGFGALSCPADLWPSDESRRDVQELSARCAKAGLALFLELDLKGFPIDHPIVERHPDHFAIRREGPREQPVDPRRPLPATGEALARLQSAEAAAALVDVMTGQLQAWVDAGAAGFRIRQAERIAAPPLAQMIDGLRKERADLLFLAGPLGADRQAGRHLAAAGIDFLVGSFGWWDGKAPWLSEELEELRGAAPVLCEVRCDQPLAVETRLTLAATLGSGLILPCELLPAAMTHSAFAGGSAGPGQVAEFAGEVRHVSVSTDLITAILRGNDPDLRHADRALLILTNTGSTPQPVPTGASLSSIVGAFCGWRRFEDSGSVDGDLQPDETRLLLGERPRPVITRPAARKPAIREADRLVVEDISPSVAGGDFAVKRVVGDVVVVEATVFADGHEQLAAELRWRAADQAKWASARMKQLPNDRWRAEFPLERIGRHEFVVEGWLDRFGGFRRDFRKKLGAGVAQPVDHAEGRQLVAQAVDRTRGKIGTALAKRLSALDRADEARSAELLLDKELAALMDAADDRPYAALSRVHTVDAERLQARFSSWYELFPRSMTDDRSRHGTFADVIEHLPRIRDMGFDTLYFPPIHPIGRTNRKGPNNTLTPGPGDPGSPYAIGGEEGGHDALHPELGSFEDFERLIAAAREHGLEIAIDFAIQCSPDHPWIRQHPGWFDWRPDGSIKYAENPPKKYQDIVNVDFYQAEAVPDLWLALRDVVVFWIEKGVKTFRVDNPHTKPLPFWEWMIGDVRAQHPDAIFLSEAFTRPTMMYRLAKVGFSQSYTYFTWRDTKHELVDYLTELTTTAPREFYRPHFFVNTPDINPFFLQTSGRPGFQIRAVLAATLSGLFGVYSGFELCEGTPLGPGKEEYLDSEKYEIRPRDWDAPGNIIADIRLLNRLRRSHPALQTHLNTRFYVAHNPSIIWYGKMPPGNSGTPREMIMVMVNLDPHNPQGCDFELPLWEFGLPDHAAIAVEDLVQGHRFDWHGKNHHITISPDLPYRIWRIGPNGGSG